ncbi:MAG: helix-turn-helix transcriptional regulator [Advenella sp.]|uniref:helix-turn-helix domain-containing protein n=1 Tax=Advenella sp. TaxID=1872388 RepID=UPI002583E676|nr:helix-turn-helix transcriptional regulator [Advenella sp.]MDD3758573.1 helix-turn-helix transcriptional regulator [Advenella sp.]
MQDNDMNSSFSTLVLLTLKELRLERNMHQGVLAQAAGKTPNAWSKIESGQSSLTIDGMIGACSAMQIRPSDVMNIVERLVTVFNHYGVFFHTVPIGENEDDLLPMILAYYSSNGYQALKNRPNERVSISTIGNPFITPTIPTIVRYCCEPNYREWMDNQPSITKMIPSELVS